MTSFQETRIEPKSPSISRAEDNLSNSEGPLLNRSLGRNNVGISVENISSAQSTRSVSVDRKSVSHNQSSNSYDHEKKKYCLWTITIILAIIGICNLILSITIINVLRVSKGMESLEVISEESLVKFYGKTDLDNIHLEEGVAEGYGDIPMELNSDNSDIHIKVENPRHKLPNADFKIQQNGTISSNVESFEIKDIDGEFIFSTNFPNFGLPNGVRNINVKLAQTHRIVSPLNESLLVESNRRIEIRGAESLKMEGKEIIWMADNDIKLKANDSIVINGKNGIFIDTKRIPISPAFGGTDGQSGQYKICVCMPQGKLFKMSVPTGNTKVNCASASTPQYDPCLNLK